MQQIEEVMLSRGLLSVREPQTVIPAIPKLFEPNQLPIVRKEERYDAYV